MYKCLDCGHIFEEGEEHRWKETHGFDHGPYEEFCGCPLCDGAYEETVKCCKCGGEFLEDELTAGYCEECKEEMLAEYRKNFRACYDVSKSLKESVQLNEFLASIFTPLQIEDILLKELATAGNIDCSQYIDADEEWFLEEVKEHERK